MVLLFFLIIGLFLLTSYNLIFGNPSSSLVTLLIIGSSISLIYYVCTSKKIYQYRLAVICGYVFRVVLLYFDIYGKNVLVLPGSGADSEVFYHSVCKIAEGIESSYDEVFSIIMGNIAKLIGTNRLLLQYIILLGSILAILFVVLSLEMIETKKSIKITSIWIIALLPNYAILSIAFLRESFISLCVSISVYFFLRWMKFDELLSFVCAFIFAFLGAMFHSGVVGLAVGYIVVRFLYDNKINRFHFTYKNILVTSVLVFIFMFLFINYSDSFFSYFQGKDTIKDISTNESLGGSSYARYVGDSSSILNMIIYTIPRIIYFLFSPFVWQWRGISDIIATLFNSSFYIFTVINIFIYLRKNHNSNKNIVIALVLVALCVVFIYAWGVNNTGTAVRHRDKMIALYTIMWCCTFNRFSRIKLMIK